MKFWTRMRDVRLSLMEGAVMAAERIRGRKGLVRFDELF
jgi:hypothetical protein